MPPQRPTVFPNNGKQSETRRMEMTQHTTSRCMIPVRLMGIAYGMIYGALILSMSSGLLGQSTSLDHSASTTFLDIGDECIEIDDEPWIQSKHEHHRRQEAT